jgi:hypothetical protein
VKTNIPVLMLLLLANKIVMKLLEDGVVLIGLLDITVVTT